MDGAITDSAAGRRGGSAAWLGTPAVRYAGLVVMLGSLFTVAIGLPGLGGRSVLVLSDTGQLLAAAAAAFLCGRTARKCAASQRPVWVLLSVGTGCWAAGQLVWTYFEVWRRAEVPFPSLADVGFLLFPVFAAAGLLLWDGGSRHVYLRGRDLLDGTIIAVSLLVLSWATTLGSVVAQGGEGRLAVALSLAYPVGDVVMATVVLSALRRSGAVGRAALLLVATGVGGLAVADSAYLYLVALGAYSSGDPVTGGWVFGFLFLAAGAAVASSEASAASGHARQVEAARGAPSVRLQSLLPYLPLLAAGATVGVRLLTAAPLLDLALGMVLVLLVLARQFLALSDNYRLLRELEAARDQLRHQALHDPLTGLANRALFADRLEHAFAQRIVDVSLIYCDLDNFKDVNDGMGHSAGDVLLRMVGQRLLACVRPGDTVARLGGDEFAVLVEGSSASRRVADRIVAALRQPFAVGEQSVCTSVSVGVADHRAVRSAAVHSPAERLHLRVLDEPDTAAAERLLKEADTAMYLAKAAGKGRAVFQGVSAPPAAKGPSPAGAPGLRPSPIYESRRIRSSTAK